MNDLRCPQCGLPHTKKNGHTHYGKQNYQCLSCGRQFVLDSQWIDQPTRALIKKGCVAKIDERYNEPGSASSSGSGRENACDESDLSLNVTFAYAITTTAVDRKVARYHGRAERRS